MNVLTTPKNTIITKQPCYLIFLILLFSVAILPAASPGDNLVPNLRRGMTLGSPRTKNERPVYSRATQMCCSSGTRSQRDGRSIRRF